MRERLGQLQRDQLPLCSNVDLLSALGVNQVGSGEMNDIWGWTDPLDGKEYVILGRTNGTAFIDISDPLNPVYLANVNTETSSSLWRDIKVYNNHAFIVSEAGGHGMQVFDLTRLRNITNPPVTLLRDAWYSGFGNAHNIVINEESGRAYGVGTNTASGGLHIMDISNPLNPTLLGFFSEDGYTHDAQVVNYIGPDGQYSRQGNCLCVQREHRDHCGRHRPVGRHHDCGRRIQHLRLHPPRLVDGRPPLLRGRRRVGRAIQR